ncbi:MAG: tRNA (guanosine(46)-N7)-methyltransferase TrmB [Candidatus Nanopelagicales bacterium]
MQTIPHIRTFAGRHGRLSLTQKAALQQLLAKYEMPRTPWNFSELFDSMPVVIEIGSGDGLAALAFAKAHPETILIAIDVHTPGIAQLIYEAEKNNIKNIRVVLGDALEILKNNVLDHSLAGLHIFFPDPWPKKRHHKRRLLNKKNLELLKSKLKIDSKISSATDWAEYAVEIQEELGAKLHSRPDWRPISKFEKKAINAGRKVSELTVDFLAT